MSLCGECKICILRTVPRRKEGDSRRVEGRDESYILDSRYGPILLAIERHRHDNDNGMHRHSRRADHRSFPCPCNTRCNYDERVSRLTAPLIAPLGLIDDSRDRRASASFSIRLSRSRISFAAAILYVGRAAFFLTAHA